MRAAIFVLERLKKGCFFDRMASIKRARKEGMGPNMRMRFFVSSGSDEDAKNKVMASLADIHGLCCESVHSEKYWKEEGVHIVDITINKDYNDINAILNNYSDDWLSFGDPVDEYLASVNDPKTGYMREGFLLVQLFLFQTGGQELFELAMKHIYGDGVPEDNDLAFELLTQAYALGHIEAAYNLGICYHYGYGTNIDLEKAFELYLESANKGYGKGMELVGRFYNRGICVERDRKQAEAWLLKAMESADPEAAREAEKELAFMG